MEPSGTVAIRSKLAARNELFNTAQILVMLCSACQYKVACLTQRFASRLSVPTSDLN